MFEEHGLATTARPPRVCNSCGGREEMDEKIRYRAFRILATSETRGILAN